MVKRHPWSEEVLIKLEDEEGKPAPVDKDGNPWPLDDKGKPILKPDSRTAVQFALPPASLKYYIFGHPVLMSPSPDIHNTGFARNGAAHVYERFDSGRRDAARDDDSASSAERPEEALVVVFPQHTTLARRLHLPPDDAFVDFVQELLAIDPDARPSATTAKLHPFLFERA